MARYSVRLLVLLLTLLLVACGDSATATQTVGPFGTATMVSPTTAQSVAGTSTVPAAMTAAASPTIVPATTAPTTTLPPITYPSTIAEAATPQPQPIPAGTWWANATCYEIFVRSFYDSNGDGIGDLKGLTSKLDYINDGKNDPKTSLGATCIWLLPVMASPSYHGYDTIDYYSVYPQYGTNVDFKELVAQAHKRGIKVILDLVINHTSNQNSWFKDAVSNPNSPYRNWYIFTPTAPNWRSPWGGQAWWPTGKGDYYYGIFDKSQPDLNFRNPDVTKKMYDVSRFWLQDMGADGYRLDAAKHLIEDGADQQNTPETKAWWQAWQAYVTSVKPDVYTVGELNGSDTQFKGWFPDKLDQYFEFSLAGSIMKAANTGFGAALGSDLTVAENLSPYHRYAPFLTNHDQDRAASVFKTDITDKAKVAATLLFTLPGTPYVYYGEEVGAAGASGVGGDKDRRTPMQWAADAQTAGFTTSIAWYPPNASVKEYNVAAETGDQNSILTAYRRLIHLRAAHPVLSTGSVTILKTANDSVAAYIRHDDKETLVIVVNTDSKPIPAGLMLKTDKSDLLAGTYSAQELLQGLTGLPQLTVSAGGAITGYNLPALPPRTGYIVSLKK